MKYGKKDFENISVCITRDFKAKLDAMAQESEFTISQIVNDILKEFFSKKMHLARENEELQDQLGAFKKCLQEANQSYLSLQAEFTAFKKKEAVGCEKRKQEMKAVKKDQALFQKALHDLQQEFKNLKIPNKSSTPALKQHLQNYLDEQINEKIPDLPSTPALKQHLQNYLDGQINKKIPDLHAIKNIEDIVEKYTHQYDKIFREMRESIPPNPKEDLNRIWRQFASIDDKFKESKTREQADYHSLRNYVDNAVKDTVKKCRFSILKPWTWF